MTGPSAAEGAIQCREWSDSVPLQQGLMQQGLTLHCWQLAPGGITGTGCLCRSRIVRGLLRPVMVITACCVGEWQQCWVLKGWHGFIIINLYHHLR